MTETLNQRAFVEVYVGSTVIELVDYLPTGSRWHHALIGVSGGAVRWLGIPTEQPGSAYGAYVGAGGQVEWLNPEIDYAGVIYNAKFIKAGINDAKLEVSLFW